MTPLVRPHVAHVLRRVPVRVPVESGEYAIRVTDLLMPVRDYTWATVIACTMCNLLVDQPPDMPDYGQVDLLWSK